jgi:uridine kinase
MIIHISGAPGSGKTTIGNWVRKNFKNVLVYDIDNLYHDYLHLKEKNNSPVITLKQDISTEMQKYIDMIIDKHKTKKIVFVGLNYPDPRIQYKNKEVFLEPFSLNMHAGHEFYLDIPSNQIIKQRLIRTLKESIENVDNILGELAKAKKEKFQIDIGRWMSDNKEWKKTFKKRGYTMIQTDKLKETLKKLLKD